MPLLLLTLGLVHGCVDTPPEPWTPLGSFRCTPGALVDCPCLVGGVGQSTCASDAVSTGPCTCPEVILPSPDSATVRATDTATRGGADGDLFSGGTTPTDPGTSDVVSDVEEDTGPEGPVGGACVDQAQETDVQANLQSLEEDAWSRGNLCMENNPGDVAGCLQDGMAQEHGLSSGCALCFAGYVLCTMENCISPCANYDSPQCVTCRTENCIADWQACMGF